MGKAMTGMVVDLGKKLCFFRAASIKDGVINDEGVSALFMGQRFHGFLKDPGRKQRGKAYPVYAAGVFKRYTASFPKTGA